jgi:hypothetical protein
MPKIKKGVRARRESLAKARAVLVKNNKEQVQAESQASPSVDNSPEEADCDNEDPDMQLESSLKQHISLIMDFMMGTDRDDEVLYYY